MGTVASPAKCDFCCEIARKIRQIAEEALTSRLFLNPSDLRSIRRVLIDIRNPT
jgi:hypothetical protein